MTKWWTCNLCNKKVGYRVGHYVEFGTCDYDLGEQEPDSSYAICPDCFKLCMLKGLTK